MPFGCVTLGDKKNYNQPSEVTDRYDLGQVIKTTRQRASCTPVRSSRSVMAARCGRQPRTRLESSRW
uniref:CaM kinase-like vesicle-associated n=1 Tax=Mus musculus TaxID=10090 RepID=A0A0A6YW08_MOUSE